MKELILNEKLTVWVSRKVTVPEDMTLEEVEKLLENDEFINHKNVEIVSSEYMMETEETMKLDDNDGYSTLELRDKNNNKLWENGES